MGDNGSVPSEESRLFAGYHLTTGEKVSNYLQARNKAA